MILHGRIHGGLLIGVRRRHRLPPVAQQVADIARLEEHRPDRGCAGLLQAIGAVLRRQPAKRGHEPPVMVAMRVETERAFDEGPDAGSGLECPLQIQVLRPIQVGEMRRVAMLILGRPSRRPVQRMQGDPPALAEDLDRGGLDPRFHLGPDSWYGTL